MAGPQTTAQGTLRTPHSAAHRRRKRCALPHIQHAVQQAPAPLGGRTAVHAATEAFSVGNTKRQIHSANFPLDEDNRTYHLGTKHGEVANCILAVGSVTRARMLADMLTPLNGCKDILAVDSSRGFLTVTGAFRGVPVSIITHLMGFGNMDIMLRETRAVVDGPLYIIRIGTCGSLNGKVGQLMIAEQGSVAVLRDPDAFQPDAVNGSAIEPYRITRPVPPDRELTAALVAEAEALMGPEGVYRGLNASADSFFSSQGRQDYAFDDRNAHVIDQLVSKYPSVCSLEMETFHLLHLAQCSNGSIRAAAGAISLADRLTDDFIDTQRIPVLERQAGEAALVALTSAHIKQNLTRCPELTGSLSVWAD